MAPLLIPILHGGAGLDVTVVEYLFRVSVLLVGMGVLAITVFAATRLAESVRYRSHDSPREQPDE